MKPMERRCGHCRSLAGCRPGALCGTVPAEEVIKAQLENQSRAFQKAIKRSVAECIDREVAAKLNRPYFGRYLPVTFQRLHTNPLTRGR